ncbi:substrate-binding periplasmic protein [Sneathiella chinensis]|uniref:ABC transporter substrate-binding protein n=1 Tax=Sneathiella chinensis TaxID=349750 RepID=A0ABQ5U804_9PROT|nr:transporter substrate-binding domain-containing protein [Sneathiella chinensis]GLQ07452.1 ABC transporter substrate-binding protein [Sneathiella chinensis]
MAYRNWSFFSVLLTVFLLSAAPVKALTETVPVNILFSNIPPLVIDEPNSPAGLLWDIGGELATRLGRASGPQTPVVRRHLLPWSRAYQQLLNTPETIMLQMARSEDRETLFHWITPVTEISLTFISIAPPAIDTVQQARQQGSIGVYRDSMLEHVLQENGFDHSLIRTNNSETGARMLTAGRLDTWFALQQEADWLHKKGILPASPVIGKPIRETELWAVASQATPLWLREQISGALEAIRKDGTLQRLKDKYGQQ